MPDPLKYFIFLNLLISIKMMNAQTSEKFIQRYEWVKRLSNTSGITSTSFPSLYLEYNKLYQFIPFTGDSAGYDSLNVRSDNPDNIFVAVCDTNGKLTSSFFLKGINLLNPLFTKEGSFYFAVDGSRQVYSGYNKIYNCTGTDEHEYRIAKCDLKGNVLLLDTFHVRSSIRLGGYNSFDGSFFIMFGDVEDYDILYHKDSLFQIGMTTLVKLNEKGKILQQWKFDGIFTDFFINHNQLNIYGKTKKIDYQFRVDNKNYYRNNISDIYTQDIVLASFDTIAGKFIWHEVIKTNGGYLSAHSNDHSFMVALSYKDTISLKGRRFNANSNYHNKKTILISFSNTGSIQWHKTAINGNASITNMQVFDHTINFLVYTYSTIPGQFSWNGMNLWSHTNNNFYGCNRLILDANGNFLSFYPLPNCEPAGIYFLPDNKRYFMNYFLQDSITLGWRKYKTRSIGLHTNDFLFAKIYNDTYFSTLNLLQKTKNDNILTVYPNPTTNSFKLRGYFGSTITLKIYDLSGNIMLSIMQGRNEAIDISNFDPGIYLVIVEFNKEKYTTKVIKQ